MTGEEQRKIAFGYLEGSDGLTKDEKKGWEAMKQAADMGDAVACFEYAGHIVSTDFTTALRYCAKGNVKAYIDAGNNPKNYVNVYVEALARNAGSNPQTAAFGLAKALELKDEITSDGWYYLAHLAKRAKPDDRTSVIEYLANANIYSNVYCGSQVPDALFREYGMEKGVLRNGDEFRRWFDWMGEKNSKAKVHVVELKKGEGMAQALAEAALDDDRSKSLGSSRRAKMKGVKPTVVLEYQKVYGQMQYMGTYSYGFKHQATGSVTYTTGSGTCEIDTWYATYSSCFKNKIKNEDLNNWVNSFDYSDEIPDARVRLFVPRESEIRRGILDRHVSSYDLITQRVARKYNWYSSDIILNNVKELNEWVPWEDDLTFVPFWFFNYKLENETVTARVNGHTGEVDFFINNPFGQFAANDNVLVNGNTVNTPGSGGSSSSGGKKKFSVGAFVALSLLFPVIGGVLYVLGYLKSK